MPFMAGPHDCKALAAKERRQLAAIIWECIVAVMVPARGGTNSAYIAFKLLRVLARSGLMCRSVACR